MIISALSWAIEAALLFRFSTRFSFLHRPLPPRLWLRPCLPMPNVLLFSSIGIYGVVYTKIAFAFCSWVSKIKKGSGGRVKKGRGEVEKELREKRKNRWIPVGGNDAAASAEFSGIHTYINIFEWNFALFARCKETFPIPSQPLANFLRYEVSLCVCISI